MDGWIDKMADFDMGGHCFLPVSYGQLMLVAFNHDHNLSLILNKLFLFLNLTKP